MVLQLAISVQDDLFVSPCAQLSGLLVDAQEEGQARCSIGSNVRAIRYRS